MGQNKVYQGIVGRDSSAARILRATALVKSGVSATPSIKHESPQSSDPGLSYKSQHIGKQSALANSSLQIISHCFWLFRLAEMQNYS